MLRRSQLFVPGTDESKIRKSVSLACDSIVFDLEDSVPQTEKDKARKTINSMVSELSWDKTRELCVRINALSDQNSKQDLEQFGASEKISALVVPKCETPPGELGRKTGKTIIPIIETARGFLALDAISRSDHVAAIAYGAADFANSLRGRTSAFQNNAFVKTAISITCNAYGVDPIDCVFFNIKDTEGFRNEAVLAKDLGYRGKQVIHPSQIEPANEIFSPTRQEIDRARKILELYEKNAQSGKGAISVDGELVDAVHYRWAKSVVDSDSTP
jgi:citrate lyase subunit beta / citryl-CoA lyase